jgi:hypothetical protein
MRAKQAVAALALAGGLVFGGSASAQVTLTAPDAAAYASFGASAALSEDGLTALVGARGDGCITSPLPCGAAYVYVWDGSAWIFQQKLVPEVEYDPSSGGFGSFGIAVALSADGNTALVGATANGGIDNFISGAVYVFVRSGGVWSLQDRIDSPNVHGLSYFGIAVAVSDDATTALVGSAQDSCALGDGCGAAYVFVRSGSSWTLQQRLTAADSQAARLFGQAVALSADGNRAVIARNGSFYEFERSGVTWTQAHKVTTFASANLHMISLSDDGETVLVGHWTQSCGLTLVNCGSALVFTRGASGWSGPEVLIASDQAARSGFGYSVALSSDGQAALIGAAPKPCVGGGLSCGAAYLFRQTAGGGWSEVSKWSASQQWLLGISTALSGDGSIGLIGADAADCAAGDNCGLALVIGAPAAAAVPVPTVGEIGLVLLACGIALGGMLLLRRRAV